MPQLSRHLGHSTGKNKQTSKPWRVFHSGFPSPGPSHGQNILLRASGWSQCEKLLQRAKSRMGHTKMATASLVTTSLLLCSIASCRFSDFLTLPYRMKLFPENDHTLSFFHLMLTSLWLTKIRIVGTGQTPGGKGAGLGEGIRKEKRYWEGRGWASRTCFYSWILPGLCLWNYDF